MRTRTSAASGKNYTMAIAALRRPVLRQIARGLGAESGLVRDYRQLGGPLRAFLIRQTRCPYEADDLLQEVFVRLLRADDQQQVRNPRAFTFKAATNLLRDRSRRCHTRMLRNVIPDWELQLQDSGGEPSLFLEVQQTIERLVRTIAKLRPNTRRAFLLYRLDAQPHAEIAAQMGISVRMVEKHISVAMGTLRHTVLDHAGR